MGTSMRISFHAIGPNRADVEGWKQFPSFIPLIPFILAFLFEKEMEPG
ncbi:MAG: hypothetical protein Q8O00_15950 [Holophaga sp.]|nr:hypothetical protein [Holophaga sp.]